MSDRKLSTKNWKELPIDKWTVTTFHEYLIYKNKEKYGAIYVPFGQGPISQRWVVEKGQIKQAYEKYGKEVILKYIDKCFETHRYNPKFPVMSFGFCWAYKRNELSIANTEVKKAEERAEMAERSDSTQIDEEWF